MVIDRLHVFLAILPFEKHGMKCGTVVAVYLGGRSIEALRGFEPFINLEVLWVNRNNIRSLDNLDSNFRMRCIYAQNNSIESFTFAIKLVNIK